MTTLNKTLTATALLLASASPLLALEEGVVTIWLGNFKADEALRGVAAAFTEELGVEVKIEVDLNATIDALQDQLGDGFDDFNQGVDDVQDILEAIQKLQDLRLLLTYRW